MHNANTHPDQNTTEDTREIHPAVISWALVIGLIVAFAVTASSFKLSFTTLLDLGSMAGLRDSAWVIPVVLDGPILAASIFRIALSQHTDRATVRGRRFIIAVFALAGVASMAGNAYHAVLTVTDLNAAVAAMMGALAPLMVMTMGEMMSVAISAPRRRIIIAAPVAGDDASTGPASIADAPDPAVEHPASRPFEAVGVEEDLDNGLLKPAVWTSVHLYLANPDWSFSDIARHLELHTSTVSRHIKTWTQVQQNIAAERSTAAPTVAADQAHSATTDVDGDHSADDAIEASSGYDADDYDSIAAGRDYAGATW
ncbi:DUF2637 domain-containing protein [Rhodococcus sp. IEGM1428]|uniref:DUF2637 domain-containing protein n=1 Tax=Rhodococcus sp. IEGM1428 TaxID=3392191 RepID=UPI003D0AB1D8